MSRYLGAANYAWLAGLVFGGTFMAGACWRLGGIAVETLLYDLPALLVRLPRRARFDPERARTVHSA